jgi:uncharacterized iron-regulated membrane protein
MIALLTTLHRWAGLALALVLLVVATSGVLLLARAPWYRWQHPSFARPVTAADRAAVPAILGRIEARFGDQVRTIKVPQPGMHVFQLWLADGSEAFVDARTGALVDRWQPTDRFPALVFDLHAHLMAGHRGELVNGAIAVLGSVFLVLGGLLVWWPRRKAMRLRALWPRTWAPGPLLRSHAAMGVITAAPLLLFLLTGAGLALGELVLPALSRALDATPPPTSPSRVAIGSTRAPWRDVLASIDEAFPAAPDVQADAPQLVFLSPGRHATAPVVARVRLPGEWHPNGRSTVAVDPYSGRVLQAVDARVQGAGTRLGHLLYPIHAARIGGSMSWLLVALAAVAGSGLAILSVSGVVTWLQRNVQGRVTRVAQAAPARHDRSPSRP